MDELGWRWAERAGYAEGGVTASRRVFVDFLVDGVSLGELLGAAWLRATASNLDLIGVFGWGVPEWTRTVGKIFLLEEPPDCGPGRTCIYVCPECGDYYCGAITARVSRENDLYVWSEFGWDNGLSEEDFGQPLPDFDDYRDIGPFQFEPSQYRQTILECARLTSD